MKKVYLIGILLLITSCVTSKITSNKSADFNEKITKIYVMVKGTDRAKPFFESFTGQLSNSLKEKGVESKINYIDPLSLDSESDINDRISSYNPNLTMIINQTESRNTVGQNGFGWGFGQTNTGGTFDVRIFQPNSKRPVWRAKLVADGDFGLRTAAKKANEKLIQKLIEDGLL